MRKRGISPIISTILIIGLVVMIAAFTLTWGMDTYRNYKEKTELDSEVALKCSETGFKVINSCVFSNTVNLVMENNGAQDISGFLYRVEAKDGSVTGEAEVSLSEYSKKTFLESFEFDVNEIGTPREIEIFPKINVEGEDYVCSISRKSEVLSCFSLLNLVDAQGFENSAGATGQSIPDQDGDGDNSNDPKPYFAIGSTQELEELEAESENIDLINEIPPGDHFVGTISDEIGWVKSNIFQIPDDERINYITYYGEGLGDFTYTLEDTDSSDEILIYDNCKNGCLGVPSAPTWDTKLDPSWRGKNVRLRINYNANELAYSFLYRLCYSENTGDGCI